METIYKTFFERAKEAVIVFNEEGIIVAANPKTEEIFGHANGALLNTNILNLISPESQFDFSLRYKSIFTENNSSADAEFLFTGICKNKTQLPLRIYMQNHIRSDNEKLIMGEILNETVNIENKKRLNELEFRFSKIFYSSPIAHTIATVAEGRIVDVNENFLKLAGYSRFEVIDKNRDNFNIFFNKADKDKYLSDIIQKREINNSEQVFITKNGARRDILLSTLVINFNDEDHFLSSIIDITEKKKAEVELKESEERFVKDFIDNPVALSITESTQHTYIAINTSYQKTLGYTKNELLGKNFIDIGLFNNANDYVKLRLLQTKHLHIRNHELELKKKSGEIVTVLLSMETIKLKNRDFILSTIIDISDKKKAENELLRLNEKIELRAEEKLKQSEELFFKIFELSQVPISIIEAESGLILNINPACEKLYSYKKKDLINKTWIDLKLIQPKDQEEIIKKALLNTDKAENVEIKIKTGDGKYKDILLSIDMINLDNKKCYLVTSFDFSERKKTEESLKNALQKEKQSNEMKSRFVSMASHQFRTPLTAILSSSDIIALYVEKNDPEKCLKHIKRIKTSVTNLTSLLNEFLSLDKLENHKVKISKETFNLTAFIMAITDEIGATLKKGQYIQYTHTGKQLINSDKVVLQNIITNLLSNAGKYSAESKKIELFTTATDNKIIICIKDYGIGIPVDEQDQIFSRLFRARNAEIIEGTGLGLNIVKSYCELLNGSISFTSEENVGSVFTVEIPQ